LHKSTACINTSTDTAYTDIHNNNVPSGLEQQHEELCSNTPSSLLGTVIAKLAKATGKEDLVHRIGTLIEQTATNSNRQITDSPFIPGHNNEQADRIAKQAFNTGSCTH